ncbi:hypothetical protein M413DRAFT_26583 [Hebeloma cylindrosporum]|uniref:Uncharacterized protein n=1 Tax=Hebeloma cylindrosporum TaxID=76867 RepID=A0A0C3CE96_HEBCY|nr:hypothetical protein M413DRAFT_26583 [Hebeloma cylindrosporum h7]
MPSGISRETLRYLGVTGSGPALPDVLTNVDGPGVTDSGPLTDMSLNVDGPTQVPKGKKRTAGRAKKPTKAKSKAKGKNAKTSVTVAPPVPQPRPQPRPIKKSGPTQPTGPVESESTAPVQRLEAESGPVAQIQPTLGSDNPTPSTRPNDVAPGELGRSKRQPAKRKLDACLTLQFKAADEKAAREAGKRQHTK